MIAVWVISIAFIYNLTIVSFTHFRHTIGYL